MSGMCDQVAAAPATAPAESAAIPAADNLWETMRLEELRLAAKSAGVRISDIEATVPRRREANLTLLVMSTTTTTSKGA